jgi:hypothetical protein
MPLSERRKGGDLGRIRDLVTQRLRSTRAVQRADGSTKKVGLGDIPPELSVNARHGRTRGGRSPRSPSRP